MIGMLVCFVVYALFYWLNGRRNKERLNVFLLSCTILGLNAVLDLIDSYAHLPSSFSLGTVFFLLHGAGLIYVLKVRHPFLFVHYMPVVILTLYYLYKLVVDGTGFDVQPLHDILLLLISVMALLYGCYGYWCLIDKVLFPALKQYFAFYIVTLFCISISFLMAYYYRVPLFSYVDFVFYLTGFSLLIAALLHEVKTFLYSKLSHYNSVVTGQLERETTRIFGEVALDVSLPENEKLSLWSSQQSRRSNLFQLTKGAVFEKEPIECRVDEIRQVITVKLIETRLFLNPVLNLEELARVLQFPKAELTEYFKVSSAATFKQYINRLRVEYAVLMIRENEENYTVEELSLLCGFNTRLSFYRAFVEVFGFAPSAIMS